MNRYEGFVGKVLDGRYKILELCGMGGMACVLKAQDLVMNRIVAIKILNDEYNGNEQAEARFIDESKAVAMLSAKNIVSVYDVAIYDDIKYIVMEYLDGITLREYLDNKGIISWKEACIYVLQILRGLEHAHSKGIIHRDIKPQNIILMKNGDIKVTDFGIAKLPNAEAEEQNEKAIGTVYYISPEQACGKETDYTSDIYSVGIMLYEAVTGTLPFTAETPMEIAMMQVNEEPVHPRDIVLDIPVGVSQIILKSMEKAPTDRFRSAHAMAKAIEWVLRNPDAIFAMDSTSAEQSAIGSNNFVSIDMIDTAEIEPYNEEDIANSLGIKTIPVIDAQKRDSASHKKSNGSRKKKKKLNRSMFPIISGVSIAFLLVAGIILVTAGINALSGLFKSDGTTESEYPNIVDLIYSDSLKDDLRNGAYGAKFVIDEVVYENREDVENNKILATHPEAGHISKPGDDGKLHFTQVTVNRSEKLTLPDLFGYPKTSAQAVLSNLSLKVEFVERSSADNAFYNDNQVIETSPSAGVEVKVGDTITVYLYNKPESKVTAAMPNVKGLSAERAMRYASNALYTPKIIEVASTENVGKIIDQSIEPGKVNPANTEVILTLAVPYKEMLMPNLIGMTFEGAKVDLMNATTERPVTLTALCFTADEALREQIGGISITSDSSEYMSALIALGCVQHFEADANGIIHHQSVLANSAIPSDISDIEVIVISYVQSEVSSPDESEEESADESSDVDSSNEDSSDESVEESNDDTTSEDSSSEAEVSN